MKNKRTLTIIGIIIGACILCVITLNTMDATGILPDITPIPSNTPAEVAFLSKRLVARLHTHDRSVVRNILRGTINKLTVDRTPQHAFGTIYINTPREPKTPSDDDEPLPPNSDHREVFGGTSAYSLTRGLTVPKPPPPMGAPLHRRSITFTFVIASRGHKSPGS